MKIKKRQMAGLALMAASVLAAILIQAFTGRVTEFHIPHHDRPRSNVVVSDILIVLHWRYDVPLAAGFVIGFVCCAWPTRKPPRTISSA
jgi:hypothetical protein